jgi:two-component system cell cycle sensor histidine kinase/response regulator CckA
VTRDGSGGRLLELSAAYRAFTAITTDYAGLLETVARQLSELIGDGCVVSLADAGGAWVEPSAAAARNPDATAQLRAALENREGRDGRGHAANVAATGTPVLVPVIDPEQLADHAEPAFVTVVRSLGIRSFLSVPLEVPGRRLGALALFRFLPDSPPFGELDVAFAATLADHAAMAIANAQLFESLQSELRQRRAAEERAQTFVSLVESSTEMISMATLEGRVLYLNAAGRKLLGVPLDKDVTVMTLADFHAKDALKRADIIRERGSWQGEGVLRHQGTGEMIATRVSSFLMHDGDGKPIGFATVQHDLRETKRLESELRQAQKMEALGRLAGGIAHDFNNLLTVILSYCSILTRTLPTDGRSVRDVEQIDRAAQRAAELTRQLLAFSRRQVLEPKPLELGATVRGMEGMIRRLIGEDIELRIITPPDDDAVMVDAGQVEQVMMNLVVNARDAMEAGGVLTLETSREGDFNTLAIVDTGTGIDARTQAHLFEPFFTTKDLGKGTGLGLSTVMGIVQQSGGHITVDSELGRGSTFRVFLPAVAKSVPAPPAPPRTLTPVFGVQRILVAEDEVEVRELICEVLQGAGYEVVDAGDGVHALEIASHADTEIHLLLTDVIMPRISGRELAARFLEVRPTARVLYMSGYTDDKLGHHGVLDPDIDLVQKPLTPEVLLHRVRVALT